MLIEERKKALVQRAKDWYEGTGDPNDIWSDLDFDQEEAEILKVDPDWDYRRVLDSQGDSRNHYLPMPKVEKVKGILRLMEVMRRGFLWYKKSVVSLPKFDGGGLVLYYSNGKLYDAITRSSTVSGKVQISKFVHLVPDKIDSNITAIECEVVCDLDKGHGDLSRQAATGLLTSKHEQERCEKELTVVAISVRFKDSEKGDWVKSMKSLPRIKHGDNTTFRPAVLNEGKYVNNKYYYEYPDGDKFSTLIDGIVTYDTESKESVAYKMYFNEKKESVVRNIEYSITPSSLKWVGTYVIDQVVVDGTKVNKATTGGLAKMAENGFGIGARVEVIKAGLTIPQIYRLINKKEVSRDYGIPFKCGCGTSITISDRANNGLFCPNSKCTIVSEIHKKELGSDNFENLVKTNCSYVIDKFLKVPSFDYKKLPVITNTYLINYLLSGNLSLSDLQKFYNFTPSQIESLNKTIPYYNEFVKNI